MLAFPIFFLALLPRLAFLWYWQVHNLDSVFSHDGHILLSEYWLGWIGRPDDKILFNSSPLFAAMSAALLFFRGGPHFFVIRLANVVLSAATPVLAWRWASRLTDSRTALLTGLLLAVSPALIFFAPHLQSESLFVFAEMIFFLCLARHWSSGSELSAMGLGLIAGAVSLVRGVFIFYLPFLTLALAWHDGRRGASARRALLLAVGWLVLPLTWGCVNRAAHGRFVPLTAQTGRTLYMGLDLSVDSQHRQQWIDTAEAEMTQEGIEGWMQRDRYLLKKSVNFIRSQPGRYVGILAQKLFRFYRPWPNSSYPRPVRIFMGTYYLFLFSLGLLGAWRTRAHFNSWLPLYAFILCLSVVHTVLDSTLRYRLPLEPFFSFFAAAGVISVFRPSKS